MKRDNLSIEEKIQILFIECRFKKSLKLCVQKYIVPTRGMHFAMNITYF